MNAWVQLIIVLLISTLIFVIAAKNSGEKVTTNLKTYLDSQKSRVVNGFEHYTYTSTTRTKVADSNMNNNGNNNSSGGSINIRL